MEQVQIRGGCSGTTSGDVETGVQNEEDYDQKTKFPFKVNLECKK